MVTPPPLSNAPLLPTPFVHPPNPKKTTTKINPPPPHKTKQTDSTTTTTTTTTKQLVTKWCDAMGVANRGIGPVVFYKGFTREFLKGNVGTSADLLRDARESVEEIGRGKKVGVLG